MVLNQALWHLNDKERDCLQRYLSILSEKMADNLQQVWLYGSAARGDMWPKWWPMHSDIDILVLSTVPVPETVQEELVNETYPLFLECGRQISPQFRTIAQFQRPEEKGREFAARVRAERQLILSNKPHET